MNWAIVIIYSVGVFVAALLCDMVIQANFTRMAGDNYEKKQMSSRACMYSLGSWVAVIYIWSTEKDAIKWTWKKWTGQL